MRLDQVDSVSVPRADMNRRFLAARRFDPDAALEQFKEACQFRQEKSVLKLYDIIPITDFEQARQFVSGSYFYPRQTHLHKYSVSPLDRSQRQEWCADMHV